ncbi:MAG: YqgE/AlgH family protein [Stellaceae bacterium]
MARQFLKLLLAPFAVLMLAAALPAPGNGGRSAAEAGSLAGQLLVASPQMGDPRFAETVILVLQQDETGAVGIVINRPAEERPFRDLLADLGLHDPDAKGTVRIFAGGPVEPTVGFVIHSAEYRRPGTMRIDGKVSVTSSPEILRDMADGAGPRKALVAFGYAGWGPGQLEAEIAHQDWFSEPEDPELVFDMERSTLWRQAFDSRSRSL